MKVSIGKIGVRYGRNVNGAAYLTAFAGRLLVSVNGSPKTYGRTPERRTNKADLGGSVIRQYVGPRFTVNAIHYQREDLAAMGRKVAN